MNISLDFTRDDLKSGYLVKLRNSELRMVMRVGRFTKVLIDCTGGWSYLSSNWGNDLRRVDLYKHCHYEKQPAKNQDIVEVYGLVEGTENYGEALCFTTEHRSLLWERTPPKKMTLAEIEAKLGFRVELVEEARP